MREFNIINMLLSYFSRRQNHINFDEELRRRVSNLEYSANIFKIDDLMKFDEILDFINTKKIRSGQKKRIGVSADGGYVVWSDDSSFIRKKNAISIGIGDEFSFEQELLSDGYVVYGVDGSVNDVFPNNNNFYFSKLFVDNGNHPGDARWTSFTQFFFSKFTSSDFSSLDFLKIDAEGSEYEIILNSKDILCHFEQIIVEFHGLELIFDSYFRDKFIEALNILLNSHTPIHVHGNNSGKGIRFPQGEFPSILEITFLKKEKCENQFDDYKYNNQLDYPNSTERPDINLSPFFSKDRNYLGLLRNFL